MTDAGWRFYRIRKVFTLKPEGDTYKANQNRDLNKRADNSCKGLARINTEYGNGHSNSQLEVIGSCGKTEGSGLLIGGTDFHGQKERYQEHDQEIDGQWHGNTDNIQGQLDNILALERKHDQNGEQEKYQGEGAYSWNKFFLIPLLAFDFDADKTGNHAAQERNAEIDKNGLGNFLHGYFYNCPLKAEPARHKGNEEIGIYREKNNLENGVKSHQPGAIFPVTISQVVPDNDHGNAAGQADENETDHIFVVAGEKRNSQEKHEDMRIRPTAMGIFVVPTWNALMILRIFGKK